MAISVEIAIFRFISNISNLGKAGKIWEKFGNLILNITRKGYESKKKKAFTALKENQTKQGRR